jgi:hypothetical protein
VYLKKIIKMKIKKKVKMMIIIRNQMVVLEEARINQNVILKVALYLKKVIKRAELIIIYQNRTI